VQIIEFDERYLQEMGELFVEVFSEPGYEWNVKTAKQYLMRAVRENSGYSLVAIDESGVCGGGVFGRVDPYYRGKLLLVDVLQVKAEFRGKGVAKELFMSLVTKAKEAQIDGLHLLVDVDAEFPKDWYERLGFRPTGWVEYEVDLGELRLEG
jgi:predicted N-acetyltransferase YhbS